MGAHGTSNPKNAPSMITKLIPYCNLHWNLYYPYSTYFYWATQQMQILLSYVDVVIGMVGARISYVRHASGAIVTVQETRGVPGQIKVEISGLLRKFKLLSN
ncbi:hypothetical protein V6N12_058497 [Hibiscus sabdariffa]|uniref:K Homology domain-containing protein n=1 Tax=Hibiscus sabdariffa TaxID=183260 RepID=A0ABR2EU68_9ROSI